MTWLKRFPILGVSLREVKEGGGGGGTCFYKYSCMQHCTSGQALSGMVAYIFVWTMED